MIQSELKPWSQVDEDDAAESAASSPLPRQSAPTPRFTTIGQKSGVSFDAGHRLSMARIRSVWAVLPLTLAGVWLLVGLVRSGADHSVLSRWSLAGVLVLLVASGVILVLAWLGRRSSLARLREELAANARRSSLDLESTPLGAELKPLWEAVERQTAEVSRQLEELLAERKELGLELSLIDVQKRQAEAILRSISDPVIVTDAYDQLVMANPAAEELFSFRCPDAYRQPIDQLIQDEKLVATIRQAREADARVARRRTEHEIGEEVYALTMSPVASEPGPSPENHGVVVILRDVTKDRQAARMKSEFVAQVAHELRTPLSSIRAYVEMLVDGEADDEKTRREYYEIIQTFAERLGRLIDNMLNISRIEAGTVRINKEAISIAVVAKEAADVMRPAAEEKGITFNRELPPVIYQVLADRDLIYQAILNLLSNAVKYTPNGGRIDLRMTPQEENRTMRIEVSDTGAGIPKEDLPRMFEKFFRVEQNKQMAKGTGLGLNLVKQIVEVVHGGELTLASEVGKGSTFTMILPLA